MFNKIFFILSIVLFCQNLSAQILIPLDEEAYLEQIEVSIQTAVDDTTRLKNYLMLSEYWCSLDSAKSNAALNVVLQSPSKGSLNEGVVDFYQGLVLLNKNEKKRGIELCQLAIEKLEASGKNKDILVKAIYHHAYAMVEEAGYDFMVEALTKRCIPLSKDLEDKKLLSFCYTQLGLTFMSVGQFETADQYHHKALKELEKLSETNVVHLVTYLNLVSNLCYKPDSKSAKLYLDKAEDIIKKYPHSLHYPNFFYQQAMYYTTIQNHSQALSSLEKGIRLAKKRNQKKILHMLYFRKYNIYLMQQDLKNAKLQLEQILAENILSKEAVNRRVTFSQLASVNELMGDFKEAYYWMKKSSALGDSLQQIKLVEKMNELNLVHETAEKKETIDKLRLEKRENELIHHNKNIRIFLLTIALISMVIIVFLFNRNYTKQKLLNKQININHEQELAQIQQERKYENLESMLRGEEQERQRIAQDLHDSIGGMLANIRMTISSKDSSESSDLLGKIDKSISEMRRISRNLMPETLKNLGLEIALKELCDSMSRDQLYIQFESFNLSNKVPFETQLALYRIAQEAISNIIKHAQAKNVIVQISQHQNSISMTIEDDGIGFDTTQVVYGLGIENIKNRVAVIDGDVEIVSDIGKGTTINVECHA